MTVYQVTRTHVSPYQNKDFLARERDLIEQFHGLSYVSPKEWEPKNTILITNTHTQLRDLPRDLLRNTKLIIHPNSGYDHFTSEMDLWKDIPLVVGHSIRAQAVAEYSLGAMFEWMLELPQHITWNAERTWNRTLLKGTDVWVFGYGHIGKVIADTLTTLGMKVTKVDPFKEGCLEHWRNGNISKARVIISAMSLNETTKHYFGKQFFNELSNEVLFINGARGKLVDETALKEYLLTHPQSFAFLDVFEKEPFGEEWHGFPQVWKTSHIAGVEKDLDQKILDFEKDVVEDFLKLDRQQFLQKYEKELIQNKWIKGVLV